MAVCPVIEPFGRRMVDIEWVSLDVGTDEVRRCRVVLSPEERERAVRFMFDRDRRRFIVARARLRQALGRRLGMAPECVELTCAEHGKPVVTARHGSPQLFFNASHADDVAVYAFAAREVGVDIETLRVLSDADEVAARMFSAREADEYSALDAGERPLAFFRCWTRKEAFVKALGQGLRYPLHRFDVSLLPNQPARILRVDDTPGESCGWALREFSPAPGVIGAVVLRVAGEAA